MVRGDLVQTRWVEGKSAWTEIINLAQPAPFFGPRLTIKSGEIAILLDDKRGVCFILSVHGPVTVLNHYVTRLEHDR